MGLGRWTVRPDAILGSRRLREIVFFVLRLPTLERSFGVSVGAQFQHKQQTCDATGKRLKGSYAINNRLNADHHTDSDSASFTQILSLAIYCGVRVFFTRQEDLPHQSHMLTAMTRCSTWSSRRNAATSITAGTQVKRQNIARVNYAIGFF